MLAGSRCSVLGLGRTELTWWGAWRHGSGVCWERERRSTGPGSLLAHLRVSTGVREVSELELQEKLLSCAV